MSKITLNNVASLQNEATALSVINGNSAIIQAAMDNTLSRDGTQPDQMNYLLDMNSNPIINLPAPTSSYMPLRLIDFQTLQSGGTITTSPLPVGGTTGQVLAKNSNTNYDVVWSSASGGAGNPGGALNSIQYNSAGGFGGISLTSGQVIHGTGTTPVAGLPAWVDVTQLGVDNTGATVTSASLQAAVNTITTANSVVYLPAGTYNMGGDSLTIPDNSTVFCHRNVIIKRTADISNVTTRLYGDYTCCLVQIGNNVRWYNGTLLNTQVAATSTTSNTLGSGTFTFTTQAGLPFAAGNFLRVWSNFNPSLHYEGTVTSYTGSTLVMNFPFFSGSGSAADWNITWGGVYQCAMVLHNSKNCVIDGMTTSGFWYVGFMMDGWNPPAGGSLAANNNTVINCQALSIQNRPFYTYGTCNFNTFINCYASGFSPNVFPGVSDYGFNMNPANASGTVNTQTKNKFIGCSVDSTSAQGFVMGELCIYNIFEGCSVNNLQNSAGTGFGIEQANGGLIPQYNTVSNCIANNCPGSGFLSVGSLYTQFVGCKAVACGNGFYLGPSTGNSTFNSCTGCHALGNTTGFYCLNTNHCDLNSIAAIGNTTGVIISSTSSVTIASGRSLSNTVNVNDNGTSTQNSLVTF